MTVGMKRTAGLLLVALAGGVFGAPAEGILDATAVQGGLVVALGWDDPAAVAGLRAGEAYRVQGLAVDEQKVREARETLQARGGYGEVCVDTFDGQRLPYVRGVVNLVVAWDLGGVAMEEVRRVLVPEGVAYVWEDGAWQKTVKPRPGEIDGWSHFLHDASGNAVAEDERVGPPKRLRWVSAPRWCRSHEFPSSVGAVVTAGGRLFTIFDEGQTGVYRKLPQRCKLVARDAANGVLLWKVPLRKWQPEFGTGRGARWEIHHTIPRRLVAAGDRVYVTLRFLDSPVSVLDAATGEVLTEALEGTRGTDEMILSDGVLIAKITEKRSMGAKARFGKGALEDTLTAVDVETGRTLWRREGVGVVPYALSAQAGRVVYHNMEELVCVATRTGKEVWRTPHVMGRTRGGDNTLVINDGVVLFHGPGKLEGEKRGGRSLIAVSLDDGEVMWTRGGGRSLAGASTLPTDVFVTDGTVWYGRSAQGVDLRTGKVVRRAKLYKLISPGHHYRCHRAKATTEYLIWPKRGAEFVDVDGEDHMRNDWLRAPCFTGAMPANGLFYVPPSQCFCYPGVNLSGFLAMAAQPADELEPSTDEEVERGPAFGQVGDGDQVSAKDWPMHRHDGERSGCTSAAVPAEVSEAWAVDLACEGTQPVVVGERLWVVEKDAHRVRCLNAATGKGLWRFTAGGRIDSAPTIYQGRVLFGCRDGSVYCLRASDGARVWRFRAAPEDRRLVAFEQVESVWPVHGSVLVQDGVVYFAAGRSSFLDGGILVYGLDATTGKVLHSHGLEGPWPDIKEDTGRPFAMEGALPDLLVSDGQNLYMGRIKFDAELNRLETKRESPLGELDMGAKHLVATGGFLDDTGFDRLYWMHSHRWPGFYFAQHAPKSGQLVVFNEGTTFAVKYFYRRIQWSPLLIPGGQGYLLFADDIENEPTFLKKGQKNPALKWLPKAAYSDRHRRGGRGVEKGTGYVRRKPPKWQEMVPVRVRAMVLAGDRLFAAGPPDVVDSDDPYAAFEGRKGAVLQVVSASDGKRLAETPLPAPPAFDGLSAANGKLYLATRDGRLLCLSGTD